MRRLLYILLVLAATSWGQGIVHCQVGRMVPLTENRGQWDMRVRYAAQMYGGALFIEEGGWTVALRTETGHPATSHPSPAIRHHAYRVSLDGSQPAALDAEGELQGYCNYFVGKEPTKWQTKVRSYSAVHMREPWPHVDLELYTASLAAKYNFVVHPGGDPKAIVLLYDGTDGVSVDRSGALHIKTSVREVVEMKPYVFQLSDQWPVTSDQCATRVSDQWPVTSDQCATTDSGSPLATDHWPLTTSVPSRWRVEKVEVGKWKVWIEVGDYDPTRDLYIDPQLIFSTYTGSTADNWGTTATYDSHKNVYTAGLVFGTGYPVSTGAYDVDYNGGADIGIFKFDSSGSTRLWATYLGGSSIDMPHSMFVNPLDELLVFGTTGSDDFPTSPGAWQAVHAGGTAVAYENVPSMLYQNGSDIFVCRLSADGTQLPASTYVGGGGNDGLNYYNHFNSGNNPYAVIMGGNDSLYYNYGDGARGEIICDDLGNVYVGSTTMSPDFPTTANCIQPNHGGQQDGVVFKLDYNLRNMLWCTYLGGNKDDAVYSIDVDSSYNLLVCGGTNSHNYTTTAGAYQTVYGGGSADGFMSKISADGRTLMASSYYGAANYDQLYFVRNGRHGDVFVFGQTKNPGAGMIHNAGYSVYNAGMLLSRFDAGFTTRRWSTLFGTPGRINLSPTAFAADICNRVYAAGWGRDFVGYNGVQWYSQGTHGMECSGNAWQDSTDGQDFYIISLDTNADNLEYATFFGELHQGAASTLHGGGDHVDGGTSRFDRMGTLYQSVCGSCGGTQHFPVTAGAWSDSNRGGNCNNALFRFNVAGDFPVADFLVPTVGCAPYLIQFTNTGRGTTYLWDFGDGTTSTEANPTHTYTAGGTYTVTLIAAMPGGCSDADTQRHTVQVLGNGAYSHTPQIACGDAGIQIGMPPALGATYLWTGSAVSDPTVSNPWVSGSGTYVLHTSTATGCTQTDTFHVQTYTLVDSWQAIANTCHDSVDAAALFRLGSNVVPDSVTVTVSPSAPYTPPQTTAGRWWFRFDSLMPDTVYHLTVSGYGCTHEQTFSAPNTPPPAYTKQAGATLCTDSCDAWVNIRYRLSAMPEILPRDTLIEGLCEGTHIIRFDVDGCPLIDTTVVVRNHTLDSLRAWAAADHIFLGESVQLYAGTSAPEEVHVDYEWSPANELDRPYSQTPIATPTDTFACYTVTATSGGCTASADVCIHCTEVVCGDPLFVIPNAFTPNGDGVNDRLCFNTDELLGFSISIFNRWGEMVYHSTDPAECWDGTWRGHKCLPGVYTYTCHIRCHAGKENDFKGDITLIR